MTKNIIREELLFAHEDNMHIRSNYDTIYIFTSPSFSRWIYFRYILKPREIRENEFRVDYKKGTYSSIILPAWTSDHTV